MALRDIVIARKEVAVGAASFSVRGLSFSDISTLVIAHKDQLIKASQIVQESDSADMGALASALAQAVPELLAHAVALAADEPDCIALVQALPCPAQLDALMAVGELTFSDPGAVPKFLADLGSVMRGTTAAMNATR